MSRRFWLSTFMALIAAATLAVGFSSANAQTNNPADYHPYYQGSAYCYPNPGNMGYWCSMGPGFTYSADPVVSGYVPDNNENKRVYAGPRRSWRQGYGRWMGCGYGW
jgi:hypothetical protein